MQNNLQEQNIYEDEIDLKELFNTILEKKFFILIITSLITIGAIIYAYSKTPIYEVKSNIRIGFIDDKLIANPDTLVKTLNIVFNIEDKQSSKKEPLALVSSISQNKKLKNFIEIKTEAISNHNALELNKKVVKYIKDKYKDVINQYILNTNNKIKSIKKQIYNLENFDAENIKREIELLKKQAVIKIDEKIKNIKEQDIINIQKQIKLLKTQEIVKIDEKIKNIKEQDIVNIQKQIKLLKTQEIVKIDEKIKFLQKVKLLSLSEKITFHKVKLEEYTKAINEIYSNNKGMKDIALLSISSMQIVNFQNLILNSQNKIEDLRIKSEKIKLETIPTLRMNKKNIIEIKIKNLEQKIDNLKNITILNLQRQKKNIQNDKIRKLQYKLDVGLPNKKIKLEEQIAQLKFQTTKQFVQNSYVVGEYVVHDYPVKPKKKLIVVVAFVTGLILSIFLVFFLNFISTKEREL